MTTVSFLVTMRCTSNHRLFQRCLMIIRPRQLLSKVILCSLYCRAQSTVKNHHLVHFFYNDVYEVLLPPNHRFPMPKYRMVREKLQSEYQNSESVAFSSSPCASEAELATTHCPNYIHRYFTGNMTPLEVRRTGFPWSMEHVHRSTSSVGGTIAAMRALATSNSLVLAGHIAGGTHHAFYDYGEGFCIFSDIAVAANLALLEYPEQFRRIVIIDLDVHQGNGNAELFKDSKQVFTFSMHCKDNYFSAKRTSNVDIELEAGTGDEAYLAKLKTWLPYLIDGLRPDLVFFQAGVDIFENDKLGRLKVTRAGLRRRNELVFQALGRKGIKCVVTMGGGYPKDLNPMSQPFQEIVECHADVYRACVETAISSQSLTS